MWAHGFRGSGLELTVDNHPLRAFLAANGYAWAASSYSRNEYDVEVGVKDTHFRGTSRRDIATARSPVREANLPFLLDQRLSRSRRALRARPGRDRQLRALSHSYKTALRSGSYALRARWWVPEWRTKLQKGADRD